MTHRVVTRRAAAFLILVPAALALSAGCDNGSAGGNAEEAGMGGRAATVEYRPAIGAGGSAVQKQRAGKLKKVTAAWVVIEENGLEVWIPKDMVLEIRMG